MGLLFNRKKNKEPVTYQVSEEQIQNLKENGVTVDIAIGYHGADEIVAGAMIGDMGKLIAMGNYGKTKYKSTTLYINEDNITFSLTGQQFLIGDDFYQWRKLKVNRLSVEFCFDTNTAGTILLKANPVNFLVIIEYVNRLFAEYTERVEQQEKEAEAIEEQNKNESDMDRLIRLGELHERGLLSDEEFKEAKAKLLK